LKNDRLAKKEYKPIEKMVLTVKQTIQKSEGYYMSTTLKVKLLSIFVLLVMVIGVSTAYATQTIVPASSLEPALQIEKPVLTPKGGKLIFSDTPETFNEAGAFYRDSAEGEFRVFWHHQNAAENTLTVSVAITNESSAPVMLFSKGSGVSTSVYVSYAGQLALADFMKTYGQKTYLATLKPGESYYVDAPTAKDLTTSGIAQFVAVKGDQQGQNDEQNSDGSAQVKVTVLAYDTKPEHPEQVPILPEQGGELVRGTFPHFDRFGTITYNTEMGNAYRPVDSAAYGQWMDTMPGEYEEGWDAVDGKTVINNGNYGVIYHWNMEFVNDTNKPKSVKMYLTPSGGYGNYTLQWGKDILESPWMSYLEAWNFSTFTLGAKEKTIKALMSLTGGSAGPQKLYFTNEEMK
jgi:hypothetical protein